MNRELKFRAWHDGKKEWLHDGKPPLGGCHILGETILLGAWCVVPLEELNDVIVEQYTGLKDRNGKEIYEGDICKAFKANSYLDGNYEIVWDGKKSRFGYRDGNRIKHNQIGCSGNLQCIIIGNIHENPELLK